MTIVRPPSRSVSRAGDRPVGRVGELEPAHGVEPHHAHPVGDQRVRPALAARASRVSGWAMTLAPARRKTMAPKWWSG